MNGKPEIEHTIQLVAPSVRAHRFISFKGTHATGESNTMDSCGVSLGDSYGVRLVQVVTGYSAMVEAGAKVKFGEYVKPSRDGSGRAVPGTMHNHCGRAMQDAARAGDLIEVMVLMHHHP
ncbi:MAG: DUF2190 domain-containing protein [Thauera sp.]|uniref:Uncharacterized protein n=1 Tax=Thauera phenylacetica B4P TaxID=1234382 RepID=N6ZT97_9RHOO|nr:hypothetical protein [Thauera phenylacetica]ENO97558.1 hypothetical protein C667_08143 [Thauera phenylacetica B4P]